MQRRRMKAFKLNEISAVDRPAQEPALAAILKRKPADVVDAVLKYWPSVGSGAKTFSELLTQEEEEKKLGEVMEVLGPAIYALEGSLRSIAADGNLDPNAKQTMMRTSVEEFMAIARTKWPEVEEELSKLIEQGANEMNKTADQLSAEVADLTKRLNDLAKSSGEKEALVAKSAKEASDALKAMTAERDTLKAIAALTDVEKAHYNALPDADKAGFLAKAAPDRAADIAKAASGDETVVIAGRTIRKSVVGPDVFAVMKAQAEDIAKAQSDLAKERDLRETEALEKRAADELGNLPGETAVKAKVLKAIGGMDKATGDALAAMLKAGDAAIKGAFSTIGSRDAAKAAARNFEKRVDEVRAANPRLSRTEALQKARTDFPDDFRAYQGDAN